MDILEKYSCLQNLQEDPQPSTFKFDLVMSIMAILTALLLSFVVYLLRSVYKLVKFHDLPMLLSVCCLILSLFCKDKSY